LSWYFECLREGPGRAIILLPGLQGSGEIFRPLLGFLPKDRSVWTVRFSEAGIGEDARLVDAAIQMHQIVEPDLICGSYGGRVGLALGAEVRSIVLTASFPSYQKLSWKSRFSLRLSEAMPAAVLEALYRRSLSRRLQNDGVDVATAHAVQAPSGTTLHSRLASLRDGQLTCRDGIALLWIVGRDDRSATWSEEDMREVWPQFNMRRVVGGHRPYASHPEPFLEEVAAWWRSMETR